MGSEERFGRRQQSGLQTLRGTFKALNSPPPRISSSSEISRMRMLGFDDFLARLYSAGLLSKRESFQERHDSFRFIEKGHRHPESQKKRAEISWRKRYLTGWQMGARCSCLIAFSVLMINISVFAWASSDHKVVKRSGTLYQGKCDQAKRINTLVQAGINVVATLLLGASNYCMQCLSAPTREEIDSAHPKKTVLHIGVPSFTNIKNINRYRMSVWVLLGLSALLIYFL